VRGGEEESSKSGRGASPQIIPSLAREAECRRGT
jgi:hypothetical protein